VSTPPQPLIDQLQNRVPRVPVTLWLIAANIAVFVIMLGFGAGLWHGNNNVQLAWGANFGPATKDGEWWRLGSALFLHFGLFHLALNMISLWDGGRLVERMFGPARFVLIYIFSGLTGNLLSLIAQGDRAVSGGASGAIFGVYGALMVFLWRERSRLNASEFKWLFWGAVGFSIVTIVLGLQITGIDNAAHIGGLIGGILAGAALMRPLDPAQHAGRGRWLAAGALITGAALLIGNIPAAKYRWSEEILARDEINQFLYEDARISARWGAILSHARRQEASFDELAGQIESEVSSPYAQSFEQLSKLHLSAAAPSASALTSLRDYAEIRRNASRALVEGLRAKDMQQIQQALEQARKAPRQGNHQAAGRDKAGE
jgi:rhomboid protease GluP